MKIIRIVSFDLIAEILGKKRVSAEFIAETELISAEFFAEKKLASAKLAENEQISGHVSSSCLVFIILNI